MLQREREAGDGAGDADAEPGVAGGVRIDLAVRADEDVGPHRRGRPLAVVDRDILLAAVILAAVEMHQHEAAAADIAGLGQRHRQRKADRHGGIDRIAARA